MAEPMPVAVSEIEPSVPPSQLDPSQATGVRFQDSLRHSLSSVEDLIGVRHRMNCLGEFLMDQKVAQLKVVSIAGIGGIGKTALASKVYQENNTKFGCHAFVTLSKKPDMGRILAEILRQISSPDTQAMDMDELISQIKQVLRDKRYLIVIDDIWATAEWETIKSALPDNDFDNRVMATTRVNAIAKTCSSGQHDLIHEVKPLNLENSAELFLAGILRPGLHRSSDQEVYAKILKKCGGVPIALKSIGPLLDGKVVTMETVMDYFPCASEELRETLFLSCSGPTNALTNCSLYLSTLPDNYKIERDSLVTKWIAEELTPEEEGRSCKEVANRCFDELINMNVIQPTEYDNSFVEQTFQVHSVMLDVLRQISQERRFATFLSSQSDISRSCAQPIYRLSVQFPDQEHSVSTAIENLLSTRSITIRGHAKGVPLKDLSENLRLLDLEGCTDLENSDVVDICRMIRLQYLSLKKTPVTELPKEIGELRDLETLDVRQTQITTLPPEIGELQKLETLDARQTPLKELPKEIGELGNLVRLYVRQTQITNLPPEIGKLQKLETLDARQTPRKELPKEIAELPKLTRLLFGKNSSLGGVKLPAGIKLSKSLKALGAVDLRESWESVIKEPSKLPELSELAVVCHDGHAEKKQNDNVLSSIGMFSKLQSLEIYGYSNSRGDLILPELRKLKVAGRCVKVPGWIWHLSALTHLDIRVCRIWKLEEEEEEEDELKKLGKLRHLRSLVLVLVSHPRKKIVISSEGFPKLEVFTFDCRVPWITFRPGAMPSLRHLELMLYAGPGSKTPSDITHLRNLDSVALHFSSQYQDGACIKNTIASMTTEARTHDNQITLSINGVEKDVSDRKIHRELRRDITAYHNCHPCIVFWKGAVVVLVASVASVLFWKQ